MSFPVHSFHYTMQAWQIISSVMACILAAVDYSIHMPVLQILQQCIDPGYQKNGSGSYCQDHFTVFSFIVLHSL